MRDFERSKIKMSDKKFNIFSDDNGYNICKFINDTNILKNLKTSNIIFIDEEKIDDTNLLQFRYIGLDYPSAEIWVKFLGGENYEIVNVIPTVISQLNKKEYNAIINVFINELYGINISDINVTSAPINNIYTENDQLVSKIIELTNEIVKLNNENSALRKELLMYENFKKLYENFKRNDER